jgi:hypothetical protein
MYADKVILPPGVGCVIGMVFNHYLYPAPLTGIMFDMLGGSVLVMKDSLIYPASVIDTTQLHTDVVSLGESREEVFSLYPNPAHASVMVEVTGQGDVAAKLYTSTGEQVLSTSVRGKAEIDTSHSPAGIYFLQIGDRVKKLVIQYRF